MIDVQAYTFNLTSSVLATTLPTVRPRSAQLMRSPGSPDMGAGQRIPFLAVV
jgi:hypothetical protein